MRQMDIPLSDRGSPTLAGHALLADSVRQLNPGYCLALRDQGSVQRGCPGFRRWAHQGKTPRHRFPATRPVQGLGLNGYRDVDGGMPSHAVCRPGPSGGKPEDEVMVNALGMKLLRKDLRTLAGLSWLNDEVWARGLAQSGAHTSKFAPHPPTEARSCIFVMGCTAPLDPCPPPTLTLPPPFCLKKQQDFFANCPKVAF